MAFLLSVLSGVLLFLGYPYFSIGFLAWIALVPLLFSLQTVCSRGEAFLRAFIAGVVFFVVSIHWLTHVTFFGWIIGVGLQASFVGLFGLLVFEGRRFENFILRSLWISLAWTASEFFRASLPPFGFGWNLLAHTQTPYPVILQSANTVGVYGLGFLIALVNGLIFQSLDPRPQTIDQKLKRAPGLKSYIFGLGSKVYSLLSLVFIFALLISHGIYHQKQIGNKLGDLRISLIQGNIPQSVKWEAMAREKILEIYKTLTQLAAYDNPALIIWPEAAFPGYFNRDRDAGWVHDWVREIEIPVVIGAPHLEGENTAYNSAYLVGPDGEIKQRYDKQNLVPFGEYVPMPWLLGWLKPLAYSLGVSDFSEGKEKTVFEILNKEFSFSTLICFEDTFPELAREFVDHGADFLAVITNDAWFGKSAAAAQHLQASIFRAVENGVPVVRAANTGISAFIDNRGHVLGQVEDAQGNPLFVMGRKTLALPVETKETLYRRGGWVFPYAALGVFVIMLIAKKIKD